jgi:hypothetical protein
MVERLESKAKIRSQAYSNLNKRTTRDIETDTGQLSRYTVDNNPDKTGSKVALKRVADVIMLDVGARKRLTEARVGTPIGSKLLQSAGSMGTHTLPAGVARGTCQQLSGSHVYICGNAGSSSA